MLLFDTSAGSFLIYLYDVIDSFHFFVFGVHSSPTTTRDGSEVFRDPRNGDVLAELVLKAKGSSGEVPVLASFSSPWPLGMKFNTMFSGNVFELHWEFQINLNFSFSTFLCSNGVNL